MAFDSAVLAILLVTGGVFLGAGVAAGQWLRGRHARAREGALEAEIAAVRDDYKEHQRRVRQHFERSSSLFHDLTRDYAAICVHLAEGSREFGVAFSAGMLPALPAAEPYSSFAYAADGFQPNEIMAASHEAGSGAMFTPVEGLATGQSIEGHASETQPIMSEAGYGNPGHNPIAPPYRAMAGTYGRSPSDSGGYGVTNDSGVYGAASVAAQVPGPWSPANDSPSAPVDGLGLPPLPPEPASAGGWATHDSYGAGSGWDPGTEVHEHEARYSDSPGVSDWHAEPHNGADSASEPRREMADLCVV